MRYVDIQRYLKPYRIVPNRATTINHAFASAIAPHDVYEEQVVKGAIVDLGQDPNRALKCVYCDSEAQTWDHVFATVKKSEFSGYGHRLGNLLPCCKPCNSRKGNKTWQVFLKQSGLDDPERVSLIEAYLTKHRVNDVIPDDLPEVAELRAVKHEVMALLAKADELAATIRAKRASVHETGP